MARSTVDRAILAVVTRLTVALAGGVVANTVIGAFVLLIGSRARATFSAIITNILWIARAFTGTQALTVAGARLLAIE